MQEYEVLDYFWYSLPQEDFDNKWAAIGWPYKIQKQIEATNEFLIEETARFYTIQLSDENALNDRIELFTMQVQQFSAARDASKVFLPTHVEAHLAKTCFFRRLKLRLRYAAFGRI